MTHPDDWWSNYAYAMAPDQELSYMSGGAFRYKTIQEAPFGQVFDLDNHNAPWPGRRIRAFSRAVVRLGDGRPATTWRVSPKPSAFLTDVTPATWGEAYAAVCDARPNLDEIPFRTSGSADDHDRMRITAPSEAITHADPNLSGVLQDLAYQITWDLSQACEVLNNPDLFYPGVDDGIEPVTDEHIDLVMWATQRELNRELRAKPGVYGNNKRPAVVLADLPHRIQRAFTERRRLRYKEWGITRLNWESGFFSFWDIPEDSNWTPPWCP